MANEEKEQMFDWGLYGMLIRKGRLDLGYRKAEEFAESIYRRTRVRISRDILYKIEQGRQTPDGTQFMAINLALSGTLFYPKIIDLCLSREWKDIENKFEENPEYDGENPYIPSDWQKENYELAYNDSEDEDQIYNNYEDAKAASSIAKNKILNGEVDKPVLFAEDLPF